MLFNHISKIVKNSVICSLLIGILLLYFGKVIFKNRQSFWGLFWLVWLWIANRYPCPNNESIAPNQNPVHLVSLKQPALLHANLPIAQHNPFLRSQTIQTHRAAHMNFVGRNANFRAQTVFKTVRKSRRCIHHNARTVHQTQK